MHGYVDRDYDKWIESEGSLLQEDQEYGPWIRVAPYVMPRKLVIKVSGYYESRKKLTDKRPMIIPRSKTTETPMAAALANCEKEMDSLST